MTTKRLRLRLEDPPRRKRERLDDEDKWDLAFKKTAKQMEISLRRSHRVALGKLRYYEGREQHLREMIEREFGPVAPKKLHNTASRKLKARVAGLTPPRKTVLKPAGREFIDCIRAFGSAIPHKRRRAAQALMMLLTPTEDT